jgi:hypothetical protein
MARQVLEVLLGWSVQVLKHSSSFLLQKNSFSGSFGTGFSSSTFTFGSTQDIQQAFLLLVVPLGQG